MREEEVLLKAAFTTLSAVSAVCEVCYVHQFVSISPQIQFLALLPKETRVM